ncbi:MAG: hypothetical protein KKA73_18335 [Chloroflexi bacterium]|nr:hypothetical protein [Chloroflexota bacterium]MBU1749646.1 hypothetical protein [Chloroflexota bacterium]
MDEYTLSLAAQAWQTLRARQDDRTKAITVTELDGQIWREWVIARDRELTQDTDRILARARPERLAELVERVWDLLAEMGEFWEYPAWPGYDPDDDELNDLAHDYPTDAEGLAEWADWAAWGIACLRWLHRERRSMVSMPCFTNEELLVWLGERQYAQLALF